MGGLIQPLEPLMQHTRQLQPQDYGLTGWRIQGQQRLIRLHEACPVTRGAARRGQVRPELGVLGALLQGLAQIIPGPLAVAQLLQGNARRPLEQKGTAGRVPAGLLLEQLHQGGPLLFLLQHIDQVSRGFPIFRINPEDLAVGGDGLGGLPQGPAPQLGCLHCCPGLVGPDAARAGLGGAGLAQLLGVIQRPAGPGPVARRGQGGRLDLHGLAKERRRALVVSAAGVD